MFAELEGILLDPCYSAKGAAGLIDLARKGAFYGERIVFLHTGGAAALGGYDFAELRACFRTLGYFTLVHERGIEWNDIDESTRTSIRQQRLSGFMNLGRRRAVLPRS